jgi:hypothetical protein
MKTPRQRRGRHRTPRRLKGGMDGVGAAAAVPRVVSLLFLKWIRALLRLDVRAHDFKEVKELIRRYWGDAGDLIEQLKDTSSESALYTSILATAPAEFIENREARIKNIVRFLWRTKTELYSDVEVPIQLAGGGAGNIHDAGKNPHRMLNLLNIITGGNTIDPANTSIGPDADPILYLKEGGRLYLPLTYFGFDESVIKAVEYGDFRAGLVKCVFHLGTGRSVDAITEAPVAVDGEGKVADWSTVTGSKPINPTKKAELGLLSSVADAVDAVTKSQPNAQLKCVAKSLGDILVIASGLPTGALPGFVNTLYGIGPEADGRWVQFAGGDAPSAPTSFVQASLDLLKCVGTIAHGIACLRQVMESTASPTGGFDYIPATVDPASLRAFYTDMVTRSRAKLNAKFDALMGQVTALESPVVFGQGSTVTNADAITALKTALTDGIPPVRDALDAYYGRLEAEVTALEVSDAALEVARQIATHAEEAVNALGPTTLVLNNRVSRGLQISANPRRFPWRGEPALTPGVFYGLPSLPAALGSGSATELKKFNDKITALRPAGPPEEMEGLVAELGAPAPAPAAASSSSASAAAASSSAEPTDRQKLLLLLLECFPAIQYDTGRWVRLTGLSATDAIPALKAELRRHCRTVYRKESPDDPDPDGDADGLGPGDGMGDDSDDAGGDDGGTDGEGSRDEDYSRYVDTYSPHHELRLFCLYLQSRGVSKSDVKAILGSLSSGSGDVDTELSTAIRSQFGWLQASSGMKRTRAEEDLRATALFNAFAAHVNALQSMVHGYYEGELLIEPTDLTDALVAEETEALGAAEMLARGSPKTGSQVASDSGASTPVAKRLAVETGIVASAELLALLNAIPRETLDAAKQAVFFPGSYDSPASIASPGSLGPSLSVRTPSIMGSQSQSLIPPEPASPVRERPLTLGQIAAIVQKLKDLRYTGDLTAIETKLAAEQRPVPAPVFPGRGGLRVGRKPHWL